MKCSVLIIISSLLIILISYICYNIKNLLYIYPPPENLKKFSCQKIPYTSPLEDFVKIDDNTLIASGANYKDLYFDFSIYNPGYQLKQGTLVLFDIKTKQLKKLEIIKFPHNLNFFPHGMKLYKNNYIYIINHGLNSIDGERFEIIEIIKEKNEIIYLKYIKSIKLPEQFISSTNGLAVVSEDDIFFTTSFPMHPPAIDKANFITKKIPFLTIVLNWILNLKMTYLYHYKNGIITKVKDSNSCFNNGVAYDPANKLIFLAQSIENNIRVYKYDSNGDINFIKDIYLGYKMDNLIFDETSRILSVGIFGFGGYSGLAEIYPDKNFEIKIPFYDIIDNNLSSAIKINNKIYIVAPLSNYLLFCE